MKTLQDLLKFLCKYAKLTGGGDYWCDSTESFAYRFYHYLFYFLYNVIAILLILEVVYNDYPTDLHNDAVSFGTGYIAALLRFWSLIYFKSKAKILSRDMAKVLQAYEEETFVKAQYKKIRRIMLFQLIVSQISLSAFIYEGLRRAYTEGIPFTVVVTYYPRFEDNSYLALVLRIIINIINLNFVLNALTCDSLLVGYLIVIYSKFSILRTYFEKLPEQCEIKLKEMNALEVRAWFKRRCVKGLIIHAELIRLSGIIQEIFGFGIAMNVCQGALVTIQIMMTVVLSTDLTLTTMMMNFLFATYILYIVALFTWSVGELTYQASLMDTAIFHCGWYNHEMESDHKDVRRIILMGCILAQKPVVIKAFGLHIISYGTFVAVLKTTYSIFALLRT